MIQIYQATQLTPDLNHLKAAAIQYAEAGFHIFPVHSTIVASETAEFKCTCGDLGCKNPGKHPSVIGGFKEATADLDKLNKWWGDDGTHRNHNIGLVPGLSGLVVIDIDPKNAGDRGLDKLIDKYGQMGFDKAPRVITGSGGNHFYFQADPNAPLSNSRGALPGGIDVRGCSGYVVAPPSLHISGNPYVWDNINIVPELMAKVTHLDPEFLKLIKGQRFLPSDRQNLSYEAANATNLESKKLAIKNALDQLDPDMVYDSWCAVGMGLHYEFRGSEEGLEMWNDWSALGLKYKDAQETNYKWESFNEGHGISIGTVFHMSKQDEFLRSELKGKLELGSKQKVGEVCPINDSKTISVTTGSDHDLNFPAFEAFWNGLSALYKSNKRQPSLFMCVPTVPDGAKHPFTRAGVYVRNKAEEKQKKDAEDAQKKKLREDESHADLVTYQIAEGWTWMCSPLLVSGILFSANKKHRFFRVHLKNASGKVVEHLIDSADLVATCKPVQQALTAKGLNTNTNQMQKWLSAYLMYNWDNLYVPPIHTYTTKPGWIVEPETKPRYQLDDMTYGGDEIVFLGTSQNAESGTLKEWQDNVTSVCAGNHRALFALSTSLAGPLYEHLPSYAETFGIHFYGGSGSGKTLMARIAASVWGDKNFIKSWDTTAAGLEDFATARNDGLLILDEIGEYKEKGLAGNLYKLFNGSGRGRSDKYNEINNTQRNTWRLSVISTGEIHIKQALNRCKEEYKEGLRARVLNVPIDAGAGLLSFDTLNGRASGNALATELLEACSKFYGVAGKSFLIAFCEYLKVPNALKRLEEQYTTLVDKLIKEVPFVDHRLSQRMSVSTLAGELAIQFNILPFESGDCLKAVIRCALDSVDATPPHGASREVAADLLILAQYFQTHKNGNFFDKDNEKDKEKPKHEGFYQFLYTENHGMVFFTPYVIKKLGIDIPSVFGFLRKLENLKQKGPFQVLVRLVDGRSYHYPIPYKILLDFNSTGTGSIIAEGTPPDDNSTPPKTTKNNGLDVDESVG
jgi:hypothetical protein